MSRLLAIFFLFIVNFGSHIAAQEITTDSIAIVDKIVLEYDDQLILAAPNAGLSAEQKNLLHKLLANAIAQSNIVLKKNVSAELKKKKLEAIQNLIKRELNQEILTKKQRDLKSPLPVDFSL